MQTRTISKEEQNLDFVLPSYIKEEVNKKGFFLYEWISPKDVKMSIERDFLSVLNILGIPLAIISVILGVVFYGNIFTMFMMFFGFIGIVSLFILLYLLFFSIRRSILLSKNAFVVLTDSSLSINGNIEKFENVNNLSKDIKNISSTFEEDLFGESRLDKTKSSLVKNVVGKLGNGYKGIINTVGRGRGEKSGQLLLLVLVLYTVYAFAMAFIYFVGVIILWIFGLFLTWINKMILLKSGHEVTYINDLFGKIDYKSQLINTEKNKLLENLENAKNNDWKDSLLTNINDGIGNISKNSNDAINESILLKTKLENSKYKDMFNFGIYNNWIKNEIFEPLNEIYNLLDINLNILNNTKKSLEKQILETLDVSLKVPLELQLNRIEMRIEDVKKYMDLIKIYMSKII